MKYKKIVVAGGGVLGSQIAFQSAYCGFEVTILIRKEDSKEKLVEKLKKLCDTYIETINIMNTKPGRVSGLWAKGIASMDEFKKEACITRAKNAVNSIVIETEQEIAVKDADLVIESVTENFDVKKSLYQELAPILDEKTVVVTNSSTLLPSKLAKYTGREEKYLAMHFADAGRVEEISFFAIIYCPFVP